jgi:hypothetical protein
MDDLECCYCLEGEYHTMCCECLTLEQAEWFIANLNKEREDG